MPSRLHLIENGTEMIVEVGDGAVRFVDDGQSVDVRGTGANEFAVKTSRRAKALAERSEFDAVAAASGQSVWVQVDGWTFEVGVSSGRGSQATADAGALAPPMPATVVRVAVTPGQAVRRGDLLVALEAMKMELPIRAPRDGVVGAIHCREGEIVQPEMVLVEMD